MFRDIILPATLWIGMAIAFAIIATVLYVENFASDCADKGGTFSNEGTTAWCRY